MDEQSIFLEALRRGSFEERAAFVRKACRGNDELVAEIEMLLKAHEKAGEFLQHSPGVEPTVEATNLEKIGTQIGPYKLLQKIGEGGMGVVYMAEQSEPVARRVALKVIKPGMDTGQVIARFEAERQALAMMDHPGIAKVFDAGATDSGRPYFVMELVKGIPISEYCDEQHFTARERMALFVQVCQAVQHAHQKGIIHRDLKPSNVLVAEYDHQAIPKIIDFGVAKATSQKLTEKTMFTQYGQIVGTLEYMSPEQAKLNQLDIDTRSDIYSLGVLLYQLLTGTTPFDRERLQSAAFEDMLRIIREEEPPKPSTRINALGRSAAALSASRRTNPQKLRQLIHGELDWIVMRALEKDRARRYETADGFAADIQHYLNDEPVVACPPTAGYRFRKFTRRNKAVLATVSTITIAVLFGLAGTTLQMIQANNARREADEQRGLAEKSEQEAKEQRDRAIEAEQNATGEAKRANREWHRANEELHISTVMRLAAESQSIGADLPVKSVLLAIEAVERSRTHKGTVTPIAHETLLSSTQNLGGRPLLGHSGRIRSPMLITHDSRWLVTRDSYYSGRLWDLTAADPSGSSLKLPVRGGKIRSFVTSFDSRWLVTGANTAQLWDLTNANPTLAPIDLPSDEGHIDLLVMSPDNRRVVTASSQGKTARVHNLNALTPASNSSIQLNGHDAPIASAAIGPLGRWLATGSWDNTARLWDLEADDPNTSSVVLLGHEDSVVTVAMSPNTGRWLATGSEDNTARLWEVNAEDPGESQIVLRGHEGTVRNLLFSPDDRWLITASYHKTALLWDLQAADPAASSRELRGHDTRVVSLAISPDGRWLVTASYDSTARIWDLATEDPSKSSLTLRGHADGVNSLAISPDSRWLVTGSHDRTARLWDLKSADPAASSIVLRGHEDAVGALAISRDGGHLVTGGWDGIARLWDLTDAEHLGSPFVLPNHKGGLRSLAISPDGRWVVTGGGNDSARLWEMTGQGPVLLRHLGGHQGGVWSAAFSPDGRRLVTGSDDNTARVWNLNAEDPASSSIELIGHEADVWIVAVSADSRYLVTGSDDNTARVWDLTAENPASTGIVLPGHRRREFYKGGQSLSISPDGRWLARAVGPDVQGTFHLQDLTTTDVSVSTLPAGSTNPIAVAYSPDGRWLCTEGRRLWDLAPNAPVPFRDLGVQRGAASIAFSSDGHRMVAGFFDNITRVWDLTASDLTRPMHELMGHRAALSRVEISRDGRWLATGSEDTTVRLWDLTAEDPEASSLVLRGHEGTITELAFPSDARMLITGSTDGTARLWDLELDSLLQRARELAGRELTAEEKNDYMLSD